MLKILLAIIILVILHKLISFLPMFVQDIIGWGLILGFIALIFYGIIKLYKFLGLKTGTIVFLIIVSALIAIFLFYNYILNII